MAHYSVVIGDALSSLASMKAKSAHCCITSPPYFNLRDYGINGQIGTENSPDLYITRLVETFRELKRVLRDDGTLWINIGDTYVSSKSGSHGLPSKSLIGIPWRLAFALQADGWLLRQDIIWHKPNPMPESVRDRCVKAHEYIFLLTKGKKYYFDHKAIQEPAVYAGQRRGGSKNRYHKNNCGADNKIYDVRNKRSVWSVKPKTYKGAHYAVFPSDLIEPCILSGCPKGGTVLDPFAGTGTTAEVAVKNDRNAIMIELNPQDAQRIFDRMRGV